jgi:sugar phosphate isomerase/epimerase
MTAMTRRAFLGASAGAAALALGRASRGSAISAPLPFMPAPFELGLASYTCREFDLDTALAMAGRVSLRRVCLKDMHLPLDLPEDAVRRAAARVRALGFVPYGCGVVYMASEEEVDRAFAYARAAGMKVVVGAPEHGLLVRAEARVRETGIRLAIHNHGPGDARYPTPRSVLDRVVGLDPRVGICLDIGHCRRSGLDPAEEAAACGPRLLDVHLKDVTAPTEAGVAVEAGRGAVDIPRFLRTLSALGYRGTAAFEYEKDGRDPLPGLAESVGYVRGVLAVQSGGADGDRRAWTKGGRP